MFSLALALLAFRGRQVELNQFLSSGTSLTKGRYFRLMALAMVETMCTTPLAVFVIVLNATAMPLEPWRSWEDTHYGFSRVEQIPAIIWRRNHLLVVSLELSRWATVICALTFFAFFGFAQEARKNYRRFFKTIVRLPGFRRFLPASPVLSNPSAPYRYDFPHLVKHLLIDLYRNARSFQLTIVREKNVFNSQEDFNALHVLATPTIPPPLYIAKCTSASSFRSFSDSTTCGTSPMLNSHSPLLSAVTSSTRAFSPTSTLH